MKSVALNRTNGTVFTPELKIDFDQKRVIVNIESIDALVDGYQETLTARRKRFRTALATVLGEGWTIRLRVGF